MLHEERVQPCFFFLRCTRSKPWHQTLLHLRSTIATIAAPNSSMMLSILKRRASVHVLIRPHGEVKSWTERSKANNFARAVVGGAPRDVAPKLLAYAAKELLATIEPTFPPCSFLWCVAAREERGAASFLVPFSAGNQPSVGLRPLFFFLFSLFVAPTPTL